MEEINFPMQFNKNMVNQACSSILFQQECGTDKFAHVDKKNIINQAYFPTYFNKNVI
jgi:hypothetical protein